jgi:DNA-binding LytR/AlgR family response regulator
VPRSVASYQSVANKFSEYETAALVITRFTTKIYVEPKKTMNAWEKQLPQNLFVRIGRQHLVNILRLERMENKKRGGLLWLKGVSEPLQITHSALRTLQKLGKPI